MSDIKEEIEALLARVEALGKQVFARTQNHADSESREDLIALYIRLKDDLEVRKSELDKKERKGELSNLESAFLQPAIMEALKELRVKRGSFPSREMSDCLAGASSYLSYHLDGLNGS